MHPGEIHTLKIGATVWIWVVRLGRGRWWPGTVEGIRTVDYKPRVVVRFECRQATDRENSPPVMAGITTTAMRYLERRNPNLNGIDQPRHTPVSLLEKPEEAEIVNYPPVDPRGGGGPARVRRRTEMAMASGREGGGTGNRRS